MMAADGYAKASPNDADTLHGAGQGGPVLHSNSRGPDTTSSTAKGPDSGMGVQAPARQGSDLSGPSPVGHVVAPGQRTVDPPKITLTASKGY